MKSETLPIIVLTFILVSCTPASISTPTETPIPVETVTPVPPVLTVTPTITPSPTETPDPNRPSDATGKDSTGYYKDVQENGKTIRYYWFELNYGNGVEQGILKGWFASHMQNDSLNNGIPLYDRVGDKKMVPFYYLVQEGIQAPYIKHLGSITPQNTAEISYTDFSQQFMQEIMEKYLDKTIPKISFAERTQFENDFFGGKISFPFTTTTGNYVWKLTQKTGYKFYAIKWDDADPATHPGFYETHQASFKYRWTIFTDLTGNLIVIEAVKYGDVMDAENFIAQGKVDSKYADSLFLMGILFPMEQVLALRQLPAKIKYWQGYFSNAPDGLIYYAFRSKCTKATYLEGPDAGKVVNFCFVAQFEIVQNP